MNITDYKTTKKLDAKNKTSNVTVLLVNGTPALRIKKYNPDTGLFLNEETEISVDVTALKKQVANLQLQIENINELITDAEALIE